MPKKVLIVEDSELQAKMYRTVFAPRGWNLVFACNGLEALDKLTLEKDVNLIILDINMPKMDGLTFLKTMREKGLNHFPVIVISTEGKEEDIYRALQIGAKAYIKKPWKPEQLNQIVEKMFNEE